MRNADVPDEIKIGSSEMTSSKKNSTCDWRSTIRLEQDDSLPNL